MTAAPGAASVPSAPGTAVTAEPVAIGTPDGVQLAGRLYRPAGEIRRAVVLNGATAVPQRFYAAFAAWLAETEGAAVLTYDYRDFGASAAGSMRLAKATMAQWGVVDQSAALDHLCARYPEAEIWMVGHSLGGVCLPFHARAGRVGRVVTVCAGPAYWLNQPLSFLPALLVFWWLVGPLATLLLGYMPGRLIGLGADVPRGVYWQWRRWCLSRDFFRRDWGRLLPVPRLDSVTCPLTIVAVSDDKLVPPGETRRLAELYPAARISHRLIRPDEIGAQRIGHLHIFSERNAKAWPMLLEGAA